MKRKLLLAALCVVGALGMRAQTDVTSTYITNADFSTTEGWTLSASSQYHDQGVGLIGAYAVANNKTSTTDDTHLATEYCMGFQCRWQTNFTNYTQTKSNAELPVGAYTVTFDVENTNTSTTKATYNNLFYVKVGETTYADTSTEWMNGNTGWTTHTISFSVEEATTADFMISLGYGTGSTNNFGTGATPHLYVSHLNMTYSAISRPTAIALNETSLALTVGGTSTLTATITPSDANTDTDITWKTSDATVATVADGVVTAVGPGTATITATTANNLSATCNVTVSDVAEAAAPAFYSTAIESGTDYYLYNAYTGTFLSGANAWGTQATLVTHGIPMTATLVSEGVYTLKTYAQEKVNTNKCYFNGTYIDGNSTNLYITSLGNGKYSISTADGSAFVTANVNDNIVANTAPTANSVLAQWYFISKDNMESALANATDASPVDATFYIGDPNFSRNYLASAYNHNTRTLTACETYPWTCTPSNYNLKGGANENYCAESYCAAGTISQTLSVPNGKYLVKCQGFYRQESGSAVSYLYANDDATVALHQIQKGGVNSMAQASTAFSNGEYKNTLTVYVTDGTLKVGIKCDAATNWTIWDNFELYYCGPIIGGEAEELPETAMAAGKWYYFDIDVDGMYNLTTTTLSDIVYTTDGTILVENESSVTGNFAQAENAELTAGRYYVKSASEQVFSVTPGAYAYNVGAVTLSAADGAYIQTSTYTVTFPAAATNDPDASAALAASATATVNGNSVALTAVENGFSLDLGTLTENTDYVISIPAGVYGYAEESMNEAINVTLHTPAVFDGEYVLYDAATKTFLGRGCAWGTEASTDKYGIPFNLVTDAAGVSSIEFVDWTGVYLFSTDKGNEAGMYTDNASTGWTILSAGSGNYKVKDASGDVYARVDNGGYGYYVHTVAGADNATVWTLKTKAERDDIIAAYPNQNIENVITAAGLAPTAQAYMAEHPEITDIKAAATAYVAANYNAVDCTDLIGTATFAGAAGDWTWSQVRGQDNQPAYGEGFCELWVATGSYTQTIDKANLSAGIYKVTVQGYERRKDNSASTALKDAGYNLVSTYLSANGEQVRFTDWNDVDGKPTSTADAVTAFTNGAAVNEVFVYLDGNTDLTLTVKKPNYVWDCWAIFNNFTLTRYEELETANMVVDATAKYATFCAPFEVTIPEGVTAYTVKAPAEGNVLTLEEMTATIPANKPVVLYSGAEVDKTFKGVAIDEEEPTNGILVGTYESIPAPEGSYVLQLHDGNTEPAFYRVESDATFAVTVPANRAYLTLSGVATANVRTLFFSAEGEATGIAGLEVLTSGNYDAIYTAGGAKVESLQKGLNIVVKDGKSYKIFVK